MHLSHYYLGGLIASAWTSLDSIGEDNFIKHTKELMEIKDNIVAEIENIKELEIIGNPHMCVFAIVSNTKNLDIFVSEVIDEILLHYVGVVNDSIDYCGILAINN